MRFELVIAAPIIYMTAAAAVLACETSDACLRELGAAQRGVQSLSAQFVQTKTLALMDEPIRTTGTFAFQRPDRVLWRMDDPPLEMRIDGAKVSMEPRNEGMMRAMPPGLESLLGGMSAMFNGDVETAKQKFDIEAAEEGGDLVVRMQPKKSSDRQLIDSMRLTFRGAERELQRIELAEAVGDRLEIVFQDVHRNDAAAAAAFSPR